LPTPIPEPYDDGQLELDLNAGSFSDKDLG
jgi:hypothetical protein